MINKAKGAAARFSALPRVGGWRFIEQQSGFEVTRFAKQGGGAILSGTSVGTEAGQLWSLRYVIRLDARWCARSATIENDLGQRLKVRADGAGRWIVNGRRSAVVDGCLDLDLEASLVTNMAPVRRLALRVNESSEAPAAYVRHENLKVERLEQTYRRVADKGRFFQFDYDSPRFGYHARLSFARDGLVVDYPHIGVRVAAR
jgi:hypothetical protein